MPGPCPPGSGLLPLASRCSPLWRRTQRGSCHCPGAIIPCSCGAMGKWDSTFLVLINCLYLPSVNTPHMKVVT